MREIRVSSEHSASSAASGGSTARTLAEILREAARRLREAGVDTPQRDARILVAAALGLDAADIIANPSIIPAERVVARAALLVERRVQREPVSRILGRRAFYGRDFTVTPATLDPRPDTETLVDLVLDLADEEGWRNRPVRIIDVGTGTGCILLTLLAELPLARGLGTDVSIDALRTAEANADALGVADRLELRQARSLEGIEGSFDLLVSNPPYIPANVIPTLDPEVRLFDPLAALDGGPDGLAVLREIAAGLARVVPAGWAAFEVGAGQADAAIDVLGADPARIRTRRDLGGQLRVVATQTHF